MIFIRSTYFIAKAALFLGCFFVLAGCENDVAEVNDLFKKKVAIEEALKVESYMSQDGKVKAKLTAPYMLRQQMDSAYYEFPRTLHVDFYDSLAVIETIMDAKYAKYREYDSKVLLRDSVVVINIRNHDTLRTSELWWDQHAQMFYSDKPSFINKADGTVTRSDLGMRAKQDLSWYELYNTTGQLPVPKDSIP